jgi:hypothetical protein
MAAPGGGGAPAWSRPAETTGADHLTAPARGRRAGPRRPCAARRHRLLAGLGARRVDMPGAAAELAPRSHSRRGASDRLRRAPGTTARRGGRGSRGAARNGPMRPARRPFAGGAFAGQTIGPRATRRLRGGMPPSGRDSRSPSRARRLGHAAGERARRRRGERPGPAAPVARPSGWVNPSDRVQSAGGAVHARDRSGGGGNINRDVRDGGSRAPKRPGEPTR